MARASALQWTNLVCQVEGVLDRQEHATRFTEIVVKATLHVPGGVAGDRAARILEKAEQTCLVTNSLSSEVRFEGRVEASQAA